MTYKVRKSIPDGRINTCGVRLLDDEMVVISKKEVADQLERFGYEVVRTTHKVGTYPRSAFDQKAVKKDE